MSTLPDGPQALDELAASAEGAIVSRVLLKTSGGSTTLFAFAEGEGLSEHSTPHEALIVILDGDAEVSIDGQAHTVRAGHVIRLPASVPHAVHAPVNVRLLLVILRD